MSAYQYGATKRELPEGVRQIVAMHTERHLARIALLEQQNAALQVENKRLTSALAVARSKPAQNTLRASYWANTFDDPRFLALVETYRERNRHKYRDTPEICHQRLIEATRESAAWIGRNSRERKEAC